MKVDFVTGALPYTEKLRWPVFLLAPLDKEPFIPKRHGGSGVHDATCDGEQIRAWGKLCPNGNIAVACGEKSGIVVIDVDPRHAGDSAIRGLAAKHSFPKTPRARTGNGGYHLVLCYQEGIRSSAGKLGPGLDVRSTGGYIVAPPSFTGPSPAGSGGLYVWELSPFDLEPPVMPAWLVEMLSPPPRQITQFAPGAGDGSLSGILRFVAKAPDGNRNNGLYWAACRCREIVENGFLSEMEAIHRLSEAAVHAGLSGTEAMRTILSGLKGNTSGGERRP
jgi:hypothetical protein